MEIPADVMVTWVRGLLDDLVRRGYVVQDERYDDGNFGNAEIILSRAATSARLVRDRGQWFVELAPTGIKEWFSPVIWRAFIEARLPSSGIIPVEDQAKWLISHLDGIEAVNRHITKEQVSDLLAWRTRRAAVRRALPPTS